MKTTALALAVALGLAAGATVPAVAAAEEGQAVAVAYKDLNLNSEEGQEELKRRLDKAARQACGMNAGYTNSRIESRSAAKCFEQARRQTGKAFATILENARLGG
jgi:UrcA family protein